jgi:hypothetical protein
MIKRLLLTAALLAPALAYGQLSVPLSPLPPVAPAQDPTVPAPAAAAGFTTPVINADFTTPGNFWSNTANYITNCGAAASVPNQPTTWHFTNAQTFTNNQSPCSQTSIVIDTAGGGNQALRKLLGVGEVSTNDGSLTFPTPYGQGGASSWLPNERFIVVTARLDCLTRYQQACPPGFVAGQTNGEVAFWSTEATGLPAWIDLNDLETGYPSRCCSWNGSIGDFSHALPDAFPVASATDPMTAYHTIATLYTSDESSAIWACQWVDPNPSYTTGFIGCISYTGASSGQYTQHNRYYLLSTSLIPTKARGGVQSYPMSLWIKSFAMWSCTNFATQTCPGTMVTHWPFP